MAAKESNDINIEELEEPIVINDDPEEKTDDEIAKAMKAAEEFKDMAQRIQAEFDNYRKRNVEAIKTSRNDGIEDVITALLPVIDNFERGLGLMDESSKTGIELIYKQVMSVMEKFEVKEIKALGCEFDPKFHHAIAQAEDPDNANKVVEVFQKGYIRKNKVLRPAMVKVAQ